MELLIKRESLENGDRNGIFNAVLAVHTKELILCLISQSLLITIGWFSCFFDVFVVGEVFLVDQCYLR